MKKLYLTLAFFLLSIVNIYAQQLVRPISAVNSPSPASPLCLICSVSNPTRSYDNDDLSFAKYSTTLAARGASIGQMFTFATKGCIDDTVYIKLMNLSNVADSNLTNIQYFSSLNGVSNADAKTVTKAGVTTSPGGNFSIVKFVPKKTFNQITLRLNVNNLGTLNEINVYDISMWTDQIVVVGGNTSVCFGDSTEISVSNSRNIGGSKSITYTWYTSDTGSISFYSGNGPVKTGPVTKDTVFYLENCAGGIRMPVTIKVLPKPSRPAISGIMKVCKGSSTTLTASSPDGGAVFRWVDPITGDEIFGKNYTTKALDEETKILVYTILGPCVIDTPDTVTIKVDMPLAAPIINCGVPTINSVTFEWSSVPGATGYLYSLDGGLTFDSALLRTDLTIPGLNFGDSRTIVVKAIGPLPCGNSVTSLAVTCIATNCTAVSFDDPQIFSACKGNYVELRVDNISTSTYEVSFAGGPFLRDNTNNYLVLGDVSIPVEVRNYNQPGCPGTKKTINVVGKDNPEPKFSADRLIVTVPGGTVQFYDQTDGAVERFWDFGDGKTSTEQYPNHKYDSVGKYTVSLQVKNKEGCVSSSQIVDYIEGKLAPSIVIPNVFSPNGDNTNDKFEVRTTRILDKDFYLSIFSPNGQKVFETFSKNEKWDGKFGSIDLPVGPYFYTLNAISDDNQKFEKKGLVNIIR